MSTVMWRPSSSPRRPTKSESSRPTRPPLSPRSTLNEVLTTRDVNEIADTPAGLVTDASKSDLVSKTGPDVIKAPAPTTVSFAEVKRDGKVEFEESKPSTTS